MNRRGRLKEIFLPRSRRFWIAFAFYTLSVSRFYHGNPDVPHDMGFEVNTLSSLIGVWPFIWLGRAVLALGGFFDPIEISKLPGEQCEDVPRKRA